MPSVARMLALVIVLAGATGLAAQAYGPDAAAGGRSTNLAASPAWPPSTPTPQTQAPQPEYRQPEQQPAYGQPAGYSPRSIPFGQPASSDAVGYAEIARPANPALQPASGSNPVVPVAYEAPGPGQPTTEPGQAASSLPATTASVPLSPPAARPSLRLSPPRRSGAGDPARPGGLPSVVTIGGSLAVVLGIFFFVAWLMRRVTPAQSSVLPAEVFEVLGRAPMANRQQVHLLRCGVKLLLVSVTPAGTETLTEITDAPEVDRLAGLCRQTKPGSATEAFRHVFEQFAPHDPQPGVLSRLLGGNRGHAEPWQGGEPTQGMGDRLENRDV